MKKFIAVAGNIGAGKSTLVEKLCSRLGWKPYFEPVSQNPYLEDFYADMDAWAYHSQVYFLCHRIESHGDLLSASGSVVQDRSVYEDAEVFAENLYRQGHINERDYRTYRKLYDVFISLLDPPDLVIYLEASVDTLLRRIRLRGRDFEAGITNEYLEQLNDLYTEWIGGFRSCPVLTIPCDDLDFVDNPGHFEMLAEGVEAALAGKQGVLFPGVVL